MKLKIIHICLASHYTEGMTYQDNQLPDQNAADGHEVVVVSDCYKYSGHQLIEVPEEDTLLPTGIRLIRMKYDFFVSKKISSKIRKVRNLKFLLENFQPDVILYHGAAGVELLTVADYKKENPEVKLYVDSHADYHNAGAFWLSLLLQYKIFNRYLVSKAKKYVDKFFYVSYECKVFCQEVYGLTDRDLEFYPLGGYVIDKLKKDKFKTLIRNQHDLNADEIVVVHSGKLTVKKKTVELIKAFSQVKDPKIKLFLIGSIHESIQDVLEPLIRKDCRIYFLGWMSSNELIKYLCAADLYIQPGTQSATLQNAICCGTPIAVYPYESHKPYVKENGFFIKNSKEYIDLFQQIAKGTISLQKMIDPSYEIAENLLDYKVLAERLYLDKV